MSKSGTNQLFFTLVGVGVLTALVIPPSVTDRAKGKEDVLLYPVEAPVRAVARLLNRKYAAKTLPPGETTRRPDEDIAAENTLLRQQVAFLTSQLEGLQRVEAERKSLGPIFDYFKPATVIGGDASSARESLAFMPTSGVDTSDHAPVMCPDGFAGQIVGGRVRLITDAGFTVRGDFGRWEEGKWVPLETVQPSVKGIGNGTMRVSNLSLKEAEKIKPTDAVVLKDPDPDYPTIVQNRVLGQVESVRPQPDKPLFAEIIVKPRTDLRKLREVWLLRKK
jgi:cell shape-determining protein MreC